MNTAYAATQGGEHGAELSVSDTILHHVQDTHVFDIWPPAVRIPLPEFELFGIDFSITKHLIMMWVASGLLIAVFTRAFRLSRPVPTGMANLLEAVVVFLRDEVILPNMGEAGKRYLPFLLTVFFFILSCNLLGMVPFAATATGNITVTASMALIAFIMIQFGGMKEHGIWHHLKNLVPHGIPFWLLPIMIPVEILGQFTKPFALCIRLFANMSAGHIVLLSLLGLSITMQSVAVGLFLSIPFAIFISLLELFVACLQAYIFTMLTSLFMGMSIQPQH